MNTGKTTSVALLSTALLAIACGPPPKPVTVAKPSLPEPPSCGITTGDHYIFTVFSDGLEIGREVRSTKTVDGPMGLERLVVSQVSRRVESGKRDFDLHTVRSERTLASEGTLLRAAYVGLEQLSVKVTLVGYNGTGWDRLVEDRQSITDPISSNPSPVGLTGREIIGFRLHEHMARIASGEEPHSEKVLYYDPSIDAPVTLSFSEPEPDELEIDGTARRGTRVTAMKEGVARIQILFAKDGTPLEERYPSLHQIRLVRSGPLDLAPESTDPPLGLFSKAYLGVPNAATRARFTLETRDERKDDALAFLGEAENQTLRRKGPTKYELEVVAQAPDGDDPPVDEDLGTTRYITPDAPVIRDALRYLRSGGTRGDLPPVRKENATTVIARVNLIRNPAAFWKDNEKVADLILSYVYAVLPDKRHTFTMADSVTTLVRGWGDCTEHSVLFASLMRAHGIPSRLIAGLYLSAGGSWVYHMWAEYWDGRRWQAVDPGNGIFRPGALYVALGRGAHRFLDLRQDVSAFLDRAFSGVSFDLVFAGNNGETLRLARPRFPRGEGPDTRVYNAMVALQRGDPAGALAKIDETWNPATASVSVALFRASLQVEAGDNVAALESVAALRSKTSFAPNLFVMDTLELEARTALGEIDKAYAVLERISEAVGEDDPTFIALHASLLAGSGQPEKALSLLRCGLETHPGDAVLLTSYTRQVASYDEADEELVADGIRMGGEALFATLYAEAPVYAALGRLYLRSGQLDMARASVDHGLVLAPLDDDLENLAAEISDAVKRCLD